MRGRSLTLSFIRTIAPQHTSKNLSLRVFNFAQSNSLHFKCILYTFKQEICYSFSTESIYFSKEKLCIKAFYLKSGEVQFPEG